jgi:large subunit ribosomal protein L3
MINTILGQKLETYQDFTQKGVRISLSKILAGPCFVMRIKTAPKDGYGALQLGLGQKKTSITSQKKAQSKGVKSKLTPLFLKEVKVQDTSAYKVGDQIPVSKILSSGDKVNITGISKGKGFTGVVKRWGFAGGPHSHGQSDRERAPGSIGQTTTPGRVRKGKKMAGRAGSKKITLKNIPVLAVDSEKNQILVKGLTPGPKKGFLIITKTGSLKKFDPLLSAKE